MPPPRVRASRLPPRAHDVSCSRRAPRSMLAWLPHPCARAARSLPCRFRRFSAPPRTWARASEPFGCFRFPCGGPLLSILRPLHARPSPSPSPSPSPLPFARSQNNCRLRPPMQAALPRSRWMVCSRVSLSASLSQHIPAASCSFLSQCPLGCCTYDTSAWRYKCMMSPGTHLLQCAASSGIILRQFEPITCQLHHLNRELSWLSLMDIALPDLLSLWNTMEYLTPDLLFLWEGCCGQLVTPRIRDAHVSRELSIILCSVPAP